MSGNTPAPVEHRHNYRRPKWDHVPIEVYGATLKRLTLEWLPHLKEAQLKVLLFIISQTLGHEKKQGSYTISQIMNGVNNKQTGGKWTEGTGLSERAVYKAMKELADCGLITKKTGRDAGWIFEVNTDWNPTGPNVTHDGNVATIHPGSQPKRPAKKPRAAGSSSAEGTESTPLDEANGTAKFAETNCKICSHPIIDISQVETLPFPSEMVALPPASRSSLPVKKQEDFTGEEKEEPPIPPIPPKAPLSPADRASKAERPMTGDTLERAWQAAWKEGQASGDILKTRHPARWSKEDKANMKRLAAEWDANAYGDFQDFIKFVITNWKTIMRKHFGWMTNPTAPDQPAVSFVVSGKFLPLLIEAYCSAETLKWIGLLPETGRNVEWQMENGLNREAAILAVARAQMEEADRKQRAEDIATAQMHYRMAELAHDAARREIRAHQKHYGPLIRAAKEHARQERGEFAPTHDRDPNEPIILEQADFSAWNLD